MSIHYYIVLIAFLTACNSSEDTLPAVAVPNEKIVQLLAEIHLANAESDVIKGTDDLTTSHNDSIICMKNGIDYQRYKATMEWYKEHPEELSKIYELVINELSRRQSENTNGSAR